MSEEDKDELGKPIPDDEIETWEGEYPGGAGQEAQDFLEKVRSLSRETDISKPLSEWGEEGEETKGVKAKYIAVGVRDYKWIEKRRFLAFYMDEVNPQLVVKAHICRAANVRMVVPKEDIYNVRSLGPCPGNGPAGRLLVRYIP